VASKNDPSAISRRVTNLVMYGAKHPYGEFSTEETVKHITLQKCKDFYSSYFRPNIGYLAIIGDITSEQAHALTSKYLGPWQRGEVPTATLPTPAQLSKNVVYVVDRPSAVQSVITIGAPVQYPFNDSAYVKARLMNDILGGGSAARLFNNLRERHGYTYGAYSSLSPSKYIGSFSASASVRTAVTDSSITEFLSEMARIGTEAVADSELVLSRNGVSGNFINSLESPQTVANFAINTERYKLAPNYYTNYLKTVASVTAQDVLNQGARFVQPSGSYIVVVGNAQEVASKLGKFGKVFYVDEYGKPVDPNPLRTVPMGVTLPLVIENYLKAIGGKDNIAKLKDYTCTYAGELQGNPFTLDIYRKRPGKITSVASVGLNEIDRNAVNGKTSVRKGQMGVTTLTGKELDNSLARSVFFWEEDLAKAQITGQVLGVEKVNDKDAYKVEFKFASGDAWIEHFDAQTHLRVKKTDTRTTPNGVLTVATTFSDYVKISGTDVLIPSTILLPMGQISVNLKLKETKANTNIPDTVFEVVK
jgi:hypothetical protein